MRYIPTTETTVKKLKTLAKQLESESGLSHSAALDAAASAMGYDNYHHVRHCRANRPGAAAVNTKPIWALLPWLLNQTPMYAGGFFAVHSKLASSRGIGTLRATVMEQVLRPGGTALFEQAASDYLHHLHGSGFDVPADVDLARGAAAGAATWTALLSTSADAGQSFRLLYQHAFFAVLAGHLRAAQEATDLLGQQTGEALAGYMLALRGATTDHDAADVLVRGEGELPREMNRHWDGSEDCDVPSTLVSRISSEVTMEAAGVIVTLPYDDIRLWNGGSAASLIWRMPVPVQADARERFLAAAAARRARDDAPMPGAPAT